jgi:hypothetical protein
LLGNVPDVIAVSDAARLASLFAWRKILERVSDGYVHGREMPIVAR